MKTLKLLTNENSGILVVNSDIPVPCPVYVIVHVVGVNLEVQSNIIIIDVFGGGAGGALAPLLMFTRHFSRYFESLVGIPKGKIH